MSELSHLRLENTASVLPYTYAQGGGRSDFPLPPRVPDRHATTLLRELNQAKAQSDAVRVQHPPLHEEIDGYPLTLRSDPGFNLKLESLDRRLDGMELLSVRVEDTGQIANVFVRRDKLVNFIRLIEKYRDEETASGRPRNQKLVDSIAQIRLLTVRDLWQDSDSIAFPGLNEEIWWEIWLRKAAGSAEASHSHFVEAARPLDIRVDAQYVEFPERVVVLAWATPTQLAQSVDLLAYVAELRRAKEVPTEYVDLQPKDQATFVDDAAGRLNSPAADAPAVCLLDTGVNRNHPLLEPALDAAETQAVRPEWGVADSDPEQHGTRMGGIALYECLTKLFQSRGPVTLRHRLESVKLLPPPPDVNDPKNYGWITQQAIARAEIQAPRRKRAICMAVTADDRDQGLPSLWSGAVDQTIAGAEDRSPKLMFISVGNYDGVLQNPDYDYPNSNFNKAGIEDPAQAWNAIGVGAFTEKTTIRDPSLAGWQPIAPAGDLTPSSRTSQAWPPDNHKGWPIKPEIVLEGGNYIINGQNRDSCDDLSLLTTIMHPTGRLLATMRDTSAATAAAARMAAIIWSYYPRLWPETVRGLLIHSAAWTPAMLARCPGEQKSDVHRRLRCFGYGVPSLPRALWSAENAATMIFEGQLQPYDKVGSTFKTKDMHLHQLPWPQEVLEELGDVNVTMRVTLSYFIEPSPERRGWGTKHRFQSHGLRFEVINPLENAEQFKQRISRALWDDDNQRPENVTETRNWIVGRDGRTRGSLHSDWWTGTAAELARCNTLAVYPVTGWWKERHHLGRWNRAARYSLIVSIETPDVNVDLYTPIMNQVTVSTELEA